MRYEDRRKELGKMLMDISKYLATAGFAGGLIAGNLSIMKGFSIVLVVVVLAVMGFYVIPLKKGD